MFNKVKKFIQDKNLIKPDSTVLIGLSGGPDSVCLLNILNNLKEELNLKLIAAHLDHEWRKDSENDVTFCKNLCDQLNKDARIPRQARDERLVKFISEKASELDFKFKDIGSKEDLGRQMRRYFFEKTAKEFGANYIALGQHLQDQEENFFIRLIRGTSLSGLTGIKVTDVSSSGFTYIRPLIETTKEEILEYLKENDLEYLTDPTNVDMSFLRNRIRIKVIPAIKECDARFDSNFLRTVHKLQAADNFIDKIAQEFVKDELDTKELLALDIYLQKRILLKWLIKNRAEFNISESFLDEMLKFLQSEHGGTHKLSDSWLIEKKKNRVKLIKWEK